MGKIKVGDSVTADCPTLLYTRRPLTRSLLGASVGCTPLPRRREMVTAALAVDTRLRRGWTERWEELMGLTAVVKLPRERLLSTGHPFRLNRGELRSKGS